MIKPLLFLLLAVSAAAAQSQTVWRCGVDGRSYADAPCSGGQVVAVADPRSAADVADARAVVARDQRLARQMVAERREREHEAAARGSGLAGIGLSVPLLKPRAAQPHDRAGPSKKQRPAAGAGTSRAAGRGSLRTAG